MSERSRVWLGPEAELKLQTGEVLGRVKEPLGWVRWETRTGLLASVCAMPMVPSSQRHHQRQHWARHRLCGSLPLYSGRGGRQQIIQTLEGKETLHFVSGTAVNTTILTFGYS